MPHQFPDTEDYAFIACTDGALNKLIERKFDLQKIDLISGDFDSYPPLSSEQKAIIENKIIHTPDQDKTDFHKALEIIKNEKITELDIYGGSGEEMDHFLGNLTTAFQFKDEMNLVFHDDYGKYFFISKEIVLYDVKNCNISIYPFPEVKNVQSKGLQWELKNHHFSITQRIGTRNRAIEDTVKIQYETGNLLLFVGNKSEIKLQ